MSFAGLLNIKVNVIRITKTPGALGGWAEVGHVLHNNLPCRINWKRGQEKIFFAKNNYFRDGKMYCKIVDINIKDRVQYNSREYEVVDVNNVDEVGRFLVLDIKLVE